MPGTVRSQTDVFSDSSAGAFLGALIGGGIGAIVGMLFLMKIFPLYETVPDSMWVFFWLVVALSATLGAILIVALIKSLELRDLRNYVHIFFSTVNHQAGVDNVLNQLATQTDRASKMAIDLRIDGVKSLGGGNAVEELDPDRVSEQYRKIQETADNNFHQEQAKFYMIFDFAAKFKEDFSLNLKDRKFKAYALSALAEQMAKVEAEKAKS